MPFYFFFKYSPCNRSWWNFCLFMEMHINQFISLEKNKLRDWQSITWQIASFEWRDDYLSIRLPLIQVLLNAQLTVSGRSGGTGSHALFPVVVVFRCLFDHALTQRLRSEEQTVKGTAYDLDHAMKMDVLVNTIKKTIIPISYHLWIWKFLINVFPHELLYRLISKSTQRGLFIPKVNYVPSANCFG